MRNRANIAKMRYFTKKILNYTKGYDYDAFRKNSILVEACIFNLSQIGEFAHKVSGQYQKAHTDVPWRTLYGLRNQIVHEYEGVNLTVVWDIISEDLPRLAEKFDQLIEAYNTEKD